MSHDTAELQGHETEHGTLMLSHGIPSMSVLLVTAQRATLTPENVDMLVFLKRILKEKTTHG